MTNASKQTPARRALVPVLWLVAWGVAACYKSGPPTAPGGTGKLLDLGPFAVGQSATFTFTSAGTFGYHCIPHRSMGMTGTVQVDAGGADSMVVRIAATGFTFEPSIAHVKPGGSVRWLNASSQANHTVTSD